MHFRKADKQLKEYRKRGPLLTFGRKQVDTYFRESIFNFIRMGIYYYRKGYSIKGNFIIKFRPIIKIHWQGFDSII